MIPAGTHLLLGTLRMVVAWAALGGTRSARALQTTPAQQPMHLLQLCSTRSEPLFCFETAIKALYFSFLVRLVDLTCGICCLPPRHLCLHSYPAAGHTA